MRISDLIIRLEKIREKYGDLGFYYCGNFRKPVKLKIEVAVREPKTAPKIELRTWVKD